MALGRSGEAFPVDGIYCYGQRAAAPPLAHRNKSSSRQPATDKRQGDELACPAQTKCNSLIASIDVNKLSVVLALSSPLPAALPVGDHRAKATSSGRHMRNKLPLHTDVSRKRKSPVRWRGCVCTPQSPAACEWLLQREWEQ